MGKKKFSKVQGLRAARRRIKQVVEALSSRDPVLLERWLADGERRSSKDGPSKRR